MNTQSREPHRHSRERMKAQLTEEARGLRCDGGTEQPQGHSDGAADCAAKVCRQSKHCRNFVPPEASMPPIVPPEPLEAKTTLAQGHAAQFVSMPMELMNARMCAGGVRHCYYEWEPCKGSI